MQTLFKKTLGNTTQLRVLEFLIEGRELDYSITDIAEGAEISRTTLLRIWEDLERSNIIKPTRVIGNAKLFQLNSQNPLVKKMIELFDEIIMPKRQLSH